MAGLNLTIALERYDRHIPLFMGSVKPPAGLTLKMLEVGMSHPGRDGVARHERFLQNNEFDIAETSLSSHVIATSRGAPFVGIPVFPRRLFSQNHIFVNRSAGIDKPEDLVGRRVLIRSFQTTMTVLALGDLTFDYGVPWHKIRWVLASDEALPLGERDGVSVEHAPAGADVSRLLIDGEVDAMIFPHLPAGRAGGSRPRAAIVFRPQGRGGRLSPKAWLLPDHAPDRVPEASPRGASVARAGNHGNVGGVEGAIARVLRRSGLCAARFCPQRV